MVAKKGKDLLLKVEMPGAGFITVAGLRARQVSLNTEIVDVTDSESAGRWRQLLADAGLRRASLSGSGLFKDAASDANIRGIFFNSTISNWQVIIPDFATLEGPFQIVSLEYAGQHDGEVTFDISLESAGEITVAEVS